MLVILKYFVIVWSCTSKSFPMLHYWAMSLEELPIYIYEQYVYSLHDALKYIAIGSTYRVTIGAVQRGWNHQFGFFNIV